MQFEKWWASRECTKAMVAGDPKVFGKAAYRAGEAPLLALAGKILQDVQNNEWNGIDYDGGEVEDMLIKAGLMIQIDVTEPCRPEGCICAEIGFPGKCNRATELGRRAALNPPASVPPPHPEDFCQECGMPNITWFAANDLWNLVVSNRERILCPTCFVRRAEKVMSCTGWKLVPENLANVQPTSREP